MKIALLGPGRTGSKVIDVASGHEVVAFDKSNTPTAEDIKQCDVVISFLTGEVLSTYIDMLVEAGVPVITGSTGIDFSEDLDLKLKQKNVTWVTSSNFAIGMNLVREMIKVLSKSSRLFDDREFTLHEIHHIGKKDSPSGTALSWQDWLGESVEFEDERIGDTVGDHKLTLETKYESISLQHTAKDRKIFASGAVWVAEKVHAGKIDAGLNTLSEIMERELR